MRPAIIAAAIMSISVASASAGNGDAESYVRSSAYRFGVPVAFALAVATVESDVSCGVIGAQGEVGPLQVNLATARDVGFRVSRRSSCADMTDAGMAALKWCLDFTDGDKIAAARCHNGGQLAAYSRRRSVNQYATRVADLERKGE